ALARYDLNGSLDTTFGSGGMVMTMVGLGNNAVAKAVAIQSDGQIVLAGFAGPSNNQEFALARYNSDGGLDASFGPAGLVQTGLGGNAGGSSVALTSDGKIVLGGSVEPVASSSASDFALARYNADGSLDNSFGSAGIVTTDLGDFSAGINKVLVEPDGKVLA